MQQVLEQKSAAMDKAGVEFNENKEQEAAKIKAKYDELAKNIKIDSKSLISALLVRKKEVSSFVSLTLAAKSLKTRVDCLLSKQQSTIIALK